MPYAKTLSAHASGDGHYDSTPLKIASLNVSDDNGDHITERNRANYLQQVERLRALESGIGFYFDAKDPEVSLKREKNDIVLTFKAAGREIVVNLGNIETFAKLSTEADINPISRSEKRSQAGDFIHHRVRTKGVDFSAEMSNAMARVIQLRYG